jgi:NAD(P)H-hydrate epimerase
MPHLPVSLYRAEQVRELDRRAIEDAGIKGGELMQRAGQAAFDLLRHEWPGARRIAVMCGSGNNGGDGFVLARLASQAGLDVSVYTLGANRTGSDAGDAAEKLAAAGVDIIPWQDGITDLRGFAIIVDALLGTGLRGEVRDAYRAVIEAMNTSHVPVLSLDIPSGLDADCGRVLGAAVRARATITFIGMKQGLFTADGPDHCGRIVFDGLRVPAEVMTAVQPSAGRMLLEALAHRLAPRRKNVHKGDHGRVLVVGGDHGMMGAAQLAGMAALRSGVGLVRLATRPAHVSSLTAAQPELMCHGIEHPAELQPLLARSTVIAAGPGLGQADWGRALFGTLLESALPMVVDADALGMLAHEPQRRHDWILTPHPGEAAALLGCTASEIQADRFAAVRAIQARYGGICVLKGVGTLVYGGKDPVGVSTAGNPGMASAGMGDVLTGVVAGLLGQQHDDDLWTRLIVAARLGVCVHAAAGDAAARDGQRGLLASDLMPYIHAIVNP